MAAPLNCSQNILVVFRKNLTGCSDALKILASKDDTDFEVKDSNTHNNVFHECVIENSIKRLKAIELGAKNLKNRASLIKALNSRNSKGDTPLLAAVRSYSGNRSLLAVIEIGKIFFEMGADSSSVNSDGKTAEQVLEICWVKSELHELLKNARLARGGLIESLRSGDLGMALKQIDDGADVLAVDACGNTTALLAVNNCKIESGILALLKKLHTKGVDFNRKNNKHETVLFLAVKYNFENVVNFALFETAISGASDSSQSPLSSSSSLSSTAATSSKPTDTDLQQPHRATTSEIDRDAAECSASRDSQGATTAVGTTAQATTHLPQSTEFLTHHFQAKVDVNLVDPANYTILHYAVDCGANEKIIEMLITANHKLVGKQNDLGQEPLHLAKKPEVVTLLCNKGASVSAKDKYDRTPINYFCEKQNCKELLQALKKFGNKAEIAEIDAIISKLPPTTAESIYSAAAAAASSETARTAAVDAAKLAYMAIRKK
jgi:ankyrin repeat protein